MAKKQIYSLFDGLNVVKVAFGGVALFFLYKLLKKTGVLSSKLEIEGDKNEAESITNAQINIAKEKAKLSEITLRNLAAQIKSAWGRVNDDEEKIYNAFSKLTNNADFLLLTEYYGYYHRLGSGDLSLGECIAKWLNQKEINKINNILKSKGITYQY